LVLAIDILDPRRGGARGASRAGDVDFFVSALGRLNPEGPRKAGDDSGGGKRYEESESPADDATEAARRAGGGGFIPRELTAADEGTRGGPLFRYDETAARPTAFTRSGFEAADVNDEGLLKLPPGLCGTFGVLCA